MAATSYGSFRSCHPGGRSRGEILPSSMGTLWIKMKRMIPAMIPYAMLSDGQRCSEHVFGADLQVKGIRARATNAGMASPG